MPIPLVLVLEVASHFRIFLERLSIPPTATRLVCERYRAVKLQELDLTVFGLIQALNAILHLHRNIDDVC